MVKCVGIGIRLPSLESQLLHSLTEFLSILQGEKKSNKIFLDALVSSDVKWGLEMALIS